MKLQVSQLQDGENQLAFAAETSEPLRKMLERIAQRGNSVGGGFRADLQLTKLEPDYYLRGRIRFPWVASCSRCAEGFTLPIDHRFELGLVHLANDRPRRTATLAEESEELDLNWFTDNELDLEPILEEQFYLSLPYAPLCQPDCRGICQTCGKNLNEGACGCPEVRGDNPFGVLKKLKV